MANLGNLWFDLGLSTKDLDKAWGDAMKKYQAQAKIDIKIGFADIDRAKEEFKALQQQARAENTTKAMADRQAIQNTIAREAGVHKIALAEQKVNTEKLRGNAVADKAHAAISNQNRALGTQHRLLQNIHTLAASYVSLFAAGRLVTELFVVSGEFEMQRVSLQAILRDLDGANKIYDQIKALAVKSPFQFKDLVSYTKQLSAFSIPMNELYDTTKMLSDVSAGLGVGMDRLVLAFGQIRAASVLRGQEIRQLTEAGVPVIENLRKKFEELGEVGITAADVFDKVSARLVPFSMIKEMFEDMTAEGGMFFNMQEIQAETLKGKISNLKDAYQIMFSEIGEKGDKVLKGSVDTVRSLIENYETVGKIIAELAITYGAYRASLIAFNVVQVLVHKTQLLMAVSTKGLSVAQALLAISTNSVTAAANKLNAALLKNPYALLAVGLAVVTYGTYKFATAQGDLEKAREKANKADEETSAKYIIEQYELGKLYERLQKVTKGSEEYEKIKSTIQNKYGDYLKNLTDEKGNVLEVADAYDQLNIKLRENILIKGKEDFLAAERENYSNAVASALKKANEAIKKAIKKGDITSEEGAGLFTELQSVILGEKALNEIEGFGDAYKKAVGGAGEGLKKIIGDVGSARASFKAMEKEAETLFGKIATKGSASTTGIEPIPNWLKKVEDYVSGLKDITEATSTNLKLMGDEGYFTYINRLRGEYGELGDKIRDAADNVDISEMKRKAEAIKGVLGILGVALDPKEKASAQKKEKDPMVIALQERAKLLEEMKKVYTDLLKQTDDASASAFLKGLFGEDISTPDILEENITNIIHMLSQLGEEGQDAAKKLEESMLKSFRTDQITAFTNKNKELNDLREQATKWLNEQKDLEDKINDLITERDSLMAKLDDEDLKGAIFTEFQGRIDKLKEEMLLLDPFWRKLFGDLSDISASAFRKLTEQAEAAVKSATEVRDKKGKVIGYNVLIDGKTAFATIAQFEQLQRKADESRKKVDRNNPYKALSDATAKLKSGEIDVKEFAVSATKNLDYIMEDAKAVGEALSGMLDALGKEEAAEAISFAVELGSTLTGMAADIASGNYVQAAVKGLQAITQILQFHDNRIQRQIEKSEFRVRQLENAYNDLGRAIDKALGEDKYKFSQMQLLNLQRQTNELREQLLLEDKKKKKDKDAIEELKQQIKDIKNESDDLIANLRDEILGDNAKGIAQTFGDALVGAIMAGDDAANVLKGSIQDIVANIAKTMLIKQLLEKPLNKIIENYTTAWVDEKGKFIGADKVLGDLPKLSGELSGFMEQMIPAFDDYLGQLNLKDIPSTSDLGGSIKGIQESTANLLGSYVNGIRADTAQIREGIISSLPLMRGINDSLNRGLVELANISANTFRSANTTDAILEKLTALTIPNGATKINAKITTG